MLSIFWCVYLPFVCLLWKNVCLGLQPLYCFFFDWAVCFPNIELMSCLYNVEIKPLSVVSFAIISPILRVVFNLVYCFLCCAKAFKFNEVPFVYFCFYLHYSRCVKEELAVIYIETQRPRITEAILRRRMELEESTCLTSDSTTKPQS